VFLVVQLTGIKPSAAEIREWGEGAGALGPLVFVPLAIGLSCVFVPFPLIAGAAGALFGVALGTGVSWVAAVGAAVVQMSITRLAGAYRPAGEKGIQHFLATRGILAVFYVRLLPGLPFVPLNYAAGATALKRSHMAIGTALAAGPRAFAYAALGGSLSNLDRPEAKVAIGVLILMAVIGLWFGRRGIRDGRGAQKGESPTGFIDFARGRLRARRSRLSSPPDR
jgi:uncharacterized membrane protein YdjX (TVP38/TMEM64 family)